MSAADNEYDEYDDDLLAALYDTDNPDGRDHDHYRSLAASTGASRITDLGCGTGLLTVTLATPGRTVVGIDPAAAMLAYASSRPSGDAVEWRLGTSALIDSRGSDLILMTGNVAMHIIGDDWHAALRDIARGLDDPGSERATVVGRLRESTSITPPDGDGVVTMRCHNEFVDAGHVVDVEQRLQFRSLLQITADLDRAGLAVLTVSGDWDGTPFTGSAAEPVMIIEAARHD